MKNINFTDWLDLWLKKDVGDISRKVNQKAKFNLIVLIEILIAIITLAIGIIAIINDCNNKFIKDNINLILIILVSLAIVVPLLIYFFGYIIKFINVYIKIKVKNINDVDVKYYKDVFDNKICSYVMMANTLHENISIDNETEAIYFICETSYYINKCINEFKLMESMAEYIFKEKNNGRVAPHRLILVVKMIKEIREVVNNNISLLKDSKSIEIINKINTENEECDEILAGFITNIKETNKNMGFEIL